MRGDPFMAIFMVKCPSCGCATELNDEKESGFCTECGWKILTAEAELYTEADAAAAEAPADAPVQAEAPEMPAAPEAEMPVVPAEVELPAVPAAEAPPSAPAPVEAHAPVPVYTGPALSNTEHLDYLILHQPQPLDSVVFHSSDECAAYVNSLHELILDAGARYAQMNHAEEATCLDFLERGIGYCDYLDTKRLRFLAGTHQEKGRTVEDYGSYPVSKAVLKDLKQAREDFVAAYNGFFTPKIAAAKAALEDTKGKIKELPPSLRFFRSFCTPVMGILTAILLAVGIFAMVKSEGKFSWLNLGILIVGAALFITWAVTTVLWVLRGRSARQLYKAAERQTDEIRGYRSKLKS